MYPARRLYRSIEQKKIGGVAAGLAYYLSLPVVFVRILFLILLVAGPGIPIYVLCWMLMPKDPAEGYPLRRRGRFMWYVAMVIAAIVGGGFVAAIGASPIGSFAFAVSLFVGMVFAFRGRTYYSEYDELAPELPEHAYIQSAEQQLRNERDDVRIYGVCLRIAKAIGIDPVVIRIAFVVLTVVTFPFAPIAYLIAALVMPRPQAAVPEPEGSNAGG